MTLLSVIILEELSDSSFNLSLEGSFGSLLVVKDWRERERERPSIRFLSLLRSELGKSEVNGCLAPFIFGGGL